MTDSVITDNTGEESEVDEAKRAFDEKVYGLCICLMSDAIVFALLLATFMVMSHNPTDGPGGQPLSVRLPQTVAQTVLLLASSATFAVAGVAIAARQRGRTLAWLSATFLLGLGFIAIEISQLYGMAAANAGPWRSGLLSAFFTVVGAHGTHVSIGLLWIVLLVGEVALRGLNPFAVSRLSRLGLFWHFLVIVWISIVSIVDLQEILEHAGSAANG